MQTVINKKLSFSLFSLSYHIDIEIAGVPSERGAAAKEILVCAYSANVEENLIVLSSFLYEFWKRHFNTAVNTC
jgi:hypothetical protein